jgi:transcriptional regulator with XRE-family HTH domain
MSSKKDLTLSYPLKSAVERGFLVRIVNFFLTFVKRQLRVVKSTAMIVNERIQRIRLHKALTLKKLSEKSGVSEAALSRIEGGSRSLPRVDTLQKIAAAFDVTTDYLLGHVDPERELAAALARQSLEIYLRQNRVAEADHRLFLRIAVEKSSPQTCEDWDKLRLNLALSRRVEEERPK